MKNSTRIRKGKFWEGDISYNVLYMWNLKRNDTDELTYRTEIHRLRERTYGCRREGWEEGIVTEFEMNIYKLLKWVTNKDLLYSKWKSSWCYVAAWMRVEFGGECICMGDTWICMAELLCCLPETITTWLIGPFVVV